MSKGQVPDTLQNNFFITMEPKETGATSRQQQYRCDSKPSTQAQVQGVFFVLVILSIASLVLQLDGLIVQPGGFDEHGEEIDYPAYSQRHLEAVLPSSSPTFSKDDAVTKSFVSTTTATSTRSSPACAPSFHGKTNITRLHFSHTRKAGGTYLRNFLTSVATLMKWELVINEGRHQEYPDRTDTVYVVNLRDPIERIISQYKYEGRWDCKQIVQNKTQFTPSLENEKTLEEDMEGIMATNRALKDSQKMWRCAQECYSQWYTEAYGKSYPTVEERYQAARERLMKYDIIVVSEYLSNPDYVSGLAALFADIDMFTLREKATIYCSEESYYWNNKMPMPTVNDTTMQKLKDWNVHDCRLYKELTDCGGAQKVAFPNAQHQKQYMNPGREFLKTVVQIPR
jgi:hypothetical protein